MGGFEIIFGLSIIIVGLMTILPMFFYHLEVMKEKEIRLAHEKTLQEGAKAACKK